VVVRRTLLDVPSEMEGRISEKGVEGKVRNRKRAVKMIPKDREKKLPLGFYSLFFPPFFAVLAHGRTTSRRDSEHCNVEWRLGDLVCVCRKAARRFMCITIF
jgi:hypothetical protein